MVVSGGDDVEPEGESDGDLAGVEREEGRRAGEAVRGGEVERVLSMVDSVLLLVDAVEGPMPQTRFVTKKALALGLKPIVVVNKVDRPGARPDYVINATFELFDKLHATEAQLDFPVIFASGLNGWATLKQGEVGTDLAPLFDAILEHVPAHEGAADAPLQLQICSLDYSTYVGRIGIGRVNQGTLKPMQDVALYSGPDSAPVKARVNQVLKFEGLERKQASEAGPGDIVLINGIEDIGIGVTLTDLERPVPLPMLKVDEPTLTMNFCVNTSPLAGREGKYVTSRQIWDRLQKELQSNVALRVKESGEDGIFEVSGRGELHLTILLETMRREGYELAVSKPRVVFKEEGGERLEPIELVTADVEDQHQGAVMQASVSAGESVGVSINAAEADAVQGSLSSPFGFADFVTGTSAVRVARPVAVAETVNGLDDQVAVVRVRQNGEDKLSLSLYRVDDLSGTIGGLAPGEAGYAAAAQGRAYQFTGGGNTLSGPGYGNYTQAGLSNVDSGDLIAMQLTNQTSGSTFWAFSQANESVGGQSVNHVWNYGLNTWGWEDTKGGGDHDFNDLVVQLDFTSASGHGWLV